MRGGASASPFFLLDNTTMDPYTVSMESHEADERERNLRALHETLGVCHWHPHIRISTGGGTPMYDGICGACEMEMDEARDE